MRVKRLLFHGFGCDLMPNLTMYNSFIGEKLHVGKDTPLRVWGHVSPWGDFDVRCGPGYPHPYRQKTKRPLVFTALTAI